MASFDELAAELAARNNSIAAEQPAGGLSADDIAAELARRANPPPRTNIEPTSRAGLAARSAIQGGAQAVGGIPALALDAVRAPYNALLAGQNWLVDQANANLGTNLPRARYIPSALGALAQGGEALADLAGTPRPQTPGEKLAVDVGSAGVGALSPNVAGTLLRGVSNLPAAVQIGQRLAQTPVLNMFSGATGEAAAKAVEDKGGTPGQSTVAQVAGSMAPYAAAAAGRRVITPMPTNLTPEQQRLAGILADSGVPLSAGQATGSKALQFAEDQAGKFPGGSLVFPPATATQRPAFTRAVLQHAGIDAKAATPEVLDQANRNIGNTIGGITGGYTVHFDPRYAQDIHALAGNYGKNLTTDQNNTIAAYLKDLRNQGATISGETYQKTRSNIGRAIRAQNGPGGDKEYQNALSALQNALDDAAERSMVRAGAVDDVTALRTARQQYANLMTIEDAVARSGQAGASGEINASALANSLKANVGRRQYTRGFGDMNDIARAGDALIRPLPDSSTAARSAIPALFGLAGTGWVAAGPIGAAAAAGAPAVAGAAINNPLAQRYLRNQLFPQTLPSVPLGAIPGLLGQ